MATRNPNLNIRPELIRKEQSAEEEKAANEQLVGPRPAWWWTGKEPTACPGYNVKQAVLHALPLPNVEQFTRLELLDYFDNCWTQTELLLASLQGNDAFYRSPYHQLRHPMIFYLCHPAVLYVNKFRVAGLLNNGIDQFYEQLFETGVDEMSWDDLSLARDDWPTVRGVIEYRRRVYTVIRDIVANHPSLASGKVTENDPAWAIFMGFEHERIHVETSSVLIRELPLQFVRKPEHWPQYHPSVSEPSPAVPVAGVDYPDNGLVEVPAERVVLGKHRQYPAFGWDNEYGSKTIDVRPFKASKCMITNGEFLEFVKAGGYITPALWSQDGWGWRTFRNVKWPTFWVPNGPAGLHHYKLRALFDTVDMRWDWPVDANYHEAKAYCAWRTQRDGQRVAYRIITEAEHMLLRNTRDRVDAHRFLDEEPVPALVPAHAVTGYSENGGGKATPAVPAAADARRNLDVVMHCSGADAVAEYGFNFQLAHSSQSPVTALPASEKGFHDTLGNAWEWGEDHFAALEGFRVHPYYDDFSAPCFAGLHHMIIGGSFISTGQLASKHARYQFRPHFFQHAGLRLVQSTVDLEDYDLTAASAPIMPMFETSCMDGAPPHIGSGPCCSCRDSNDVHINGNRAAITRTREESSDLHRSKLEHAQDVYETDALMGQYLSLHFGPLDKVYGAMAGQAGMLGDAVDFPRKCGQIVNEWADRAGVAGGRALDLGCAVGGASFEMARRFEQVVGIDISNRFVDAAASMAASRRMDYELPVEGSITERCTAAIADDVDTSRTSFRQGDACALPADLGKFDAVLMANLLCRVPSPKQCLEQVTAALNSGGLLVITSPFSWFEEYTEKSKWLGGYAKEDGSAAWSADGLKARLAGAFEVLQEDSMPLVIREHSRKFQLILAHRLVLKKL